MTTSDRFLRARGRRFCGMCREDCGGPRAFTPFKFVQMSDTQLGMEATFVDYDQRAVLGHTRELELVQRAVEEVNRLRPNFVILCGDLVDEMPDLPGASLDRRPDMRVREKQLMDFKAAFSLLDEAIPLVCLCGNHDIGNRPNAVSIKDYKDQFGDDYFSFWCGGVRCLVLNSQLWKDDTDARDERIAMEVWLDSELDSSVADAANDGELPRILVFSHVAPFIRDPGERSDYFNLELEVRQRLLEKMAHKGVVAWFSGHYHRNAGGVFRTDSRELEVVVTAAVGTQIFDSEKPGTEPLGLSGIGGHTCDFSASGFRIVTVEADRIEHHWTTLAELAELPHLGKRVCECCDAM